MNVYPQNDMSLTITRSPDGPVDYVQILGDVDTSDSVALGNAARMLAADSGTIYVDLGGTTFVGSTLVAFLAHIVDSGRAGRPLVLCRPTPMARRVIHMTGLDEVATIQPDLPANWPEIIAQRTPLHSVGNDVATG
jgi:anti-anti-sigma factor